MKTVSFCAYGLFSVFQFCSASVSVSRWYLFNFIRILMISCFSSLLASYTFPLVRLAFFNYFFPLAVTSLRFDLCENIFISLSEGSVASGFLPLRWTYGCTVCPMAFILLLGNLTAVFHLLSFVGRWLISRLFICRWGSAVSLQCWCANFWFLSCLCLLRFMYVWIHVIHQLWQFLPNNALNTISLPLSLLSPGFD